jgi:DNA polymerase-1
MLIDGNSLINRAFFGLAGRNRLTAPDGTPTGALFAFLNMYLRFREDFVPDEVITAFDRKEPTFRHDMFDGYKATRKGMPDDLAVQMPILKRLVELMGIGQIELPGFEADDLLGTIALTAEAQGWDVVILTGDKDSFQLVDDHISIWQPVTKAGKTEVQKYDPAMIKDRYTIHPDQFVDLKALMGDPSDNIPGVRGIGEKGAMELVARFGSLDGIYSHLDEIKPTLADKLRENRDMAYLSYRLSQIACDVPLPATLPELAGKPVDRTALRKALVELDFRSLVNRLGLADEPAEPGQVPAAAVVVARCRIEDFSDALKSSLAHPDMRLTWAIGPLGQFYWQTSVSKLSTVYELPAEILAKAWDLLSQAKIATSCYDYKKTLRSRHLPVLQGPVHDILVAAYLLNQLEGKPDLERLYGRALNQPWPWPGSQTQDQPGMKRAPVQTDLFSLAENTAVPGENSVAQPAEQYLPEANPQPEETPLAVLAIAAMQQAQTISIAERKIEHLAYDVEMPLAGLLAEMEQAGFAIDQAVLEDLAASMQTRIDELQAQVYELSGKTFNLQSPKQLGSVLFEHLGLSTGKKRTGGNYSTDSEELERLIDQHPVIAPIIEHRLIAKLRSTFVEGLRKAIDTRDGRVHTTFNQVLTTTGRLSSTEPNLQNIPIRAEQGNRIRSAFIAAPGKILLDADYSQIELRLLAHLSGDPAMLSAFNEHQDIHLNTACHIFDLPPEQITSAQRSIAKTMNFSIVYGISDFGLARDLGVTIKQAHQYIEGYNSEYPHVRSYLDQLIRKAYETGYVETLFGRRRYLPELQSANRNLRQFGERAAMNTPIQGTAADLIKMAMVRVRASFNEAKLKSRLVLQVHDELIVEAPLAEADRAAELLKIAMEDALRLDVPLIAEVHHGYRWSDCKN